VRLSRGRTVQVAAMSVVAATVLVAIIFAGRFGADPALVPSPLIGQPAPEAELPLLTAQGSVRLSDLAGEVVVINFFASWCLQCRLEHDDLVATADAFAGQGVQFVAITYQDRIDDAIGFLDELGWSESTLYLSDPGSRAAIAYGVFGIPETFFIAPEGIVVGKVIGESNALLLGQTIDAIRRGERPGQQVTGDTQQSPTG
jgi:cytochrome c biogenesis protein CcmG/thiol:disulfide interchange protein DsbE